MTDPGYPRIVKRWRRGTPLADATVVFEGTTKDVAVSVSVDRTPGFERTIVERVVDTRRSKRYLVRGSEVAAIDLADDAKLGFVRDTMLIEPRSDWKIGDRVAVAGSLLAFDADAYLAGKREVTMLFTPTPTRRSRADPDTRSPRPGHPTTSPAGSRNEEDRQPVRPARGEGPVPGHDRHHAALRRR
jgi:prolyl oligopeptidase